MGYGSHEVRYWIDEDGQEYLTARDVEELNARVRQREDQQQSNMIDAPIYHLNQVLSPWLPSASVASQSGLNSPQPSTREIKVMPKPKITIKCPYCHDNLEKPSTRSKAKIAEFYNKLVACKTCKALIHGACWAYYLKDQDSRGIPPARRQNPCGCVTVESILLEDKGEPSSCPAFVADFDENFRDEDDDEDDDDDDAYEDNEDNEDDDDDDADEDDEDEAVDECAGCGLSSYIDEDGDCQYCQPDDESEEVDEDQDALTNPPEGDIAQLFEAVKAARAAVVTADTGFKVAREARKRAKAQLRIVEGNLQKFLDRWNVGRKKPYPHLPSYRYT